MEFELSQTGSDTPRRWRSGPGGKQIRGVTSRISNTAAPANPQAGYRVVVFDPDNVAHSYTLRGQPTDGWLLQPGTPVKGVLTDSQPYDKWQVSVPPGASVDVQVDPLDSGSLPVVNIFGPDGQTLASSKWIEPVDKIELASLSATEGGTWQLVIAQPAGAGRFVYRMTVT
jgi:hypothetical protein